MVSTVVVLGTLALLCVAAVESKPSDRKVGTDNHALFPGVGRYNYHETPSTWADAHKTCKQEGGHLTILNSDEEAFVVLDLIKSYSVPNEVYVGVHDQFQNGNYMSVRGKPMEKLGFRNWTQGQPEGGISQNCITLYQPTGTTKGAYRDNLCTALLPFVCELTLWDDYELLSGFGYYKLHNELRLWTEAWDTCRLEGGYLLVFSSIAERDAVSLKYRNQVALTPNPHVWYGAHHAFANQFFVTIFDETIEESGFSTWAAEYPGSYTNAERPFVVMHLEALKDELELEAKEVALPFICKHNLHDLD